MSCEKSRIKVFKTERKLKRKHFTILLVKEVLLTVSFLFFVKIVLSIGKKKKRKQISFYEIKLRGCLQLGDYVFHKIHFLPSSSRRIKKKEITSIFHHPDIRYSKLCRLFYNTVGIFKEYHLIIKCFLSIMSFFV